MQKDRISPKTLIPLSSRFFLVEYTQTHQLLCWPEMNYTHLCLLRSVRLLRQLAALYLSAYIVAHSVDVREEYGYL